MNRLILFEQVFQMLFVYVEPFKMIFFKYLLLLNLGFYLVLLMLWI